VVASVDDEGIQGRQQRHVLDQVTAVAGLAAAMAVDLDAPVANPALGRMFGFLCFKPLPGGEDAMVEQQMRYGIRITLPEGDAMGAPHLLGPDWESYRWFETSEERDRVFDEMQSQLEYYRAGDLPSQVLSKVQR
jgi:hypothetical protein